MLRIKVLLSVIFCLWLVFSANSSQGKELSSFTANYLATLHAEQDYNYKKAAEFILVALEKNPRNISIVDQAFILSSAAGNFKQVDELAKQLIKKKDKHALVNLFFAIQYIKNEKFSKAIDYLDKIKSDGHVKFAVPLLKAWAYVGLEKSQKAIDIIEKFQNDIDAESVFDGPLALIYQYIGDNKNAEKLYKKIFATEKYSSLRLIHMYGEFLERQGNFDLALKIYTEFQEKNTSIDAFDKAIERVKNKQKLPDFFISPKEGVADSLHLIASSLKDTRSYLLALIYGNYSLYSDPGFEYSTILIGSIYENVSRYQDVIDVYQTIKSQSMFYWYARLKMVESLNDLDKTEDAIELLGGLEKEFPKKADIYTAKGDLFRSQERYAEAIKYYSRAIDMIETQEKKYWSLYYSRGVSYEREDKWRKAEKDLQLALKLYPDQPFALNYLGYSWIEKGINLQKAEKMVRKAVDLRPHDGFITDSLGWVLYKQNRYKEAVKYLEKAVALEAGDPVINDHLADAYWKVGRKLEAKYQWKRVLTLDPDEELTESVKEKIEKGLK